MIELLKKANRFLLYFIIGVTMFFSVLSELLMFTATAAYTGGNSYVALIVTVGRLIRKQDCLFAPIPWALFPPRF